MSNGRTLPEGRMGARISPSVRSVIIWWRFERAVVGAGARVGLVSAQSMRGYSCHLAVASYWLTRRRP